ncbi:AGL365Cp [Eremothecium gossypii ATCC 10895]|uniref:AGL365Cp n=1 Tax=Eremothecium gossypii (strain ATCC 10895 / CBS 109.51 / FGSC 9923 / NRRL Y-1056) TaxID=284811 RepID=Q751Q4_EREGS|nr:AGL365Cp [Eremothecium gossypii ATCC 10895]AAS54126.1 AGL365Cp [Eremothecium gossypii ATCC 10895]AEY98452.1 FAGL365Cp [Eremothecium gossypii FDAG1]
MNSAEPEPKNIEKKPDSSSFQNEIVTVCTQYPEELLEPTEEEEKRLRHVVAAPKWTVYMICLIELAERASYYGTGDRLYNFFQYPLPQGGNGAGAGPDDQNPGALGRGLQVATSLNLVLKFTSYFFPLVTGYVADMYVGELKMLWLGIWTGVVSHVIFVIAALPAVIKHNNLCMALAVLGLLTLSLCTAFVKPVLLPMLLRQYPHETNVVKTLPTGERVILNRDASLQRMSMTFYWCINVGSFVSLATGYSAQRVGYWLSFLIPLVLFLIMPAILLTLKNVKVTPPLGESLFAECLKVIKVCFEPGWFKRYRSGSFWRYAKPSNLRALGRTGWRRSKEGFYKESLVEDTRITLAACVIFLYYVIYNMNDNQLSSIINNQAGSMTGEGVPNDVISNFNPLAIIITMPIIDYGLNPLLRRLRINFKPVYRIFFGFMLAVLASVAGAIIQAAIYNTSPCGKHASTCSETIRQVSPLSRWLVGVEYVLSGVSECFAMPTGYEIAFERSPKDMKAFVMSLFLVTTALSSILTQIFNGIMTDPYLVIPFILFAVLGTLFAILFLYRYWNLDKVMEAERRERAILDPLEILAHNGPPDYDETKQKL